ncbi:hypothetical protein BJ878DRAFT_426732 [Calycina marina]|uniref:Allergen n=1 Tax=Calycina marina TaxID=1763456 RepID=A0A9P7YZE3_9HELO|nr:hypothetical protein BJ878DRAFT_426732 [Calycina marina]
MDKAKAAVSGFLSKEGKHDTNVHESVAPAITNEQVHHHRHNEQQTAIDREVHQDHHHTSVQPIKHKEVAPEEHHHHTAPVEHREIHHGDKSKIAKNVELEKHQFKDTQSHREVQHTHADNGAVIGEHVHHHVHENIQPVIQKETYQQSVHHTVVPVHEKHHNEAKHHTATQLPAVTMAEFQQQGGKIGGREKRSDHFAGEPKQVNPLGGTPLGGKGADGTTSLTEDHQHEQHGKFGSHDRSSHHNNGHINGERGTGIAGASSATHEKPTMMDRMNPKKDADGDGKAGFMK